MIPRFDWSLNFGHLLTMVTFLLVALGSFYRLRGEQSIHKMQLEAISKWIDQHDEVLKTNLKDFQESRLQGALTTQLLQTLVARVERLEARRAGVGG